MASKAVGHFELEAERGILSGPRGFMETHDGSTFARCFSERTIDALSNALVDRILAAEDAIFNLTKDHQGDLGQSSDVATAIPVRLQTAYAGYLGLKQAEHGLDRD